MMSREERVRQVKARISDREYAMNLIRALCPKDGSGITLGGIEFFVDVDGPWKGDLSFSLPLDQLDQATFPQDLAAAMEAR